MNTLRRLHVPVHEPGGRRGVEAVAHLGDDPGGVAGVDRGAPGQDRAQVLALDQLHGDPQRAVLLPGAQHRHQVRVRQGRRQPGLAREPEPVGLLARQLGRQQLERHRPAVLLPHGQVHVAHAAAAQHALHHVAGELRAQLQVGLALPHRTASASSANSAARATSAWSMAPPSRRSRMDRAPTATPARCRGTTSMVFGT